jgi:hypothetical protein
MTLDEFIKKYRRRTPSLIIYSLIDNLREGDDHMLRNLREIAAELAEHLEEALDSTKPKQ